MQTSHQQNRTPVGVYFVNYYVYLSLALSVCRQRVWFSLSMSVWLTLGKSGKDARSGKKVVREMQ